MANERAPQVSICADVCERCLHKAIRALTWDEAYDLRALAGARGVWSRFLGLLAAACAGRRGDTQEGC